MQIFVQPEDLFIAKAKKMFITNQYIVIKSWRSPRQKRETTINQKKLKPKLNKVLPERN